MPDFKFILKTYMLMTVNILLPLFLKFIRIQVKAKKSKQY